MFQRFNTAQDFGFTEEWKPGDWSRTQLEPEWLRENFQLLPPETLALFSIASTPTGEEAVFFSNQEKVMSAEERRRWYEMIEENEALRESLYSRYALEQYFYAVPTAQERVACSRPGEE